MGSWFGELLKGCVKNLLKSESTAVNTNEPEIINVSKILEEWNKTVKLNHEDVQPTNNSSKYYYQSYFYCFI